MGESAAVVASAGLSDRFHAVPTSVIVFVTCVIYFSYRRNQRQVAIAFGIVAALAFIWEYLVVTIVPEPYLDEVFHIPQAQAYCDGKFDVWDPKLTTPPGLYVFSTLISGWFIRWKCTVESLRAGNTVTLLLLLPPILACRQCIYGYSAKSKSKEPPKREAADWNSTHTTMNICLFPPLFFFSGLYYTDVLSTVIVINAYSYFLKSRDSSRHPLVKGLGIYLWGIAALFMRQTNVFWVAIFLAALEWIRTCKAETIFVTKSRTREPNVYLDFADRIEKYAQGSLHNPKLGDTGVVDFFWCAISIAVAAICSPVRFFSNISPYIALLVSFAGFVVWNGGVVLGDKSNHVATIHLPQMLYLWPFITFFSLPLLLPYATGLLLLPRTLLNNIKSNRIHPILLSIFWITTSLLAALTVVHFNTIIHPFTLADNRHYMFYIFRYSILRHPLFKYLLAPIYLLSAYLALQALGGFKGPDTVQKVEQPPKRVAGSNKSWPQPPKQTTVTGTSNGADTSFAIIWILTTALSLVTAPLVEPRYFIVPWVLWRLHVPPALETRSEDVVEKKQDYRLWLETGWFVAIDAVTGYVFLFKGFEWPQEPGNVQRFMW